MAEDVTAATSRSVTALRIDADVVEALRERLPAVAAQTVEAITVEVPSYTGALSGSMGENISSAVQMALAGFLTLAARGGDPGRSSPHGPTIEGAYALGRGEARSGRSMDALLAAYRVGARVAWRELARAAAEAGLRAETMAEFAELVFAYIDELSAASVAGHSHELSTSGRVQERYLARLAQRLLAGAGADVLSAAAERAGWPVPRTLTAVLLPVSQVRAVVAVLGEGSLQAGEDLPGLPDGGDAGEQALLFVPDVEDPVARRHLLRVLGGRSAVVGPARPWVQARASYLRAVRVLSLGAPGAVPVDSEDHLPDLVLGADPEALADLRARVLDPLRDLRPATAERLAETLLSWLLHQGRREAVAADLHVHPQTVRYRMGQLRQRYGARLDDPATVLALVVALGARLPSPGSVPGAGMAPAPRLSRASGLEATP